ncbi:type II toxin-antitoxin system prevent-host-death family antitoxin [Pseudoxanthobacter sp. M-2]|uniref:type II toxin-antitoxin system Phd/YefM family antitoxin n=1 Tax=Pseudoxanthobacter sp. M-2 TaxID=3078754 RepID=UPI0038FC8668
MAASAEISYSSEVHYIGTMRVKTVSAADANRHFSKLLGEVERGETVQVTSRGRPVARLAPEPEADAAEREAAFRELIARLKSQPALNLGRVTRDEAYDDTDDPA